MSDATLSRIRRAVLLVKVIARDPAGAHVARGQRYAIRRSTRRSCFRTRAGKRAAAAFSWQHRLTLLGIEASSRSWLFARVETAVHSHVVVNPPLCGDNIFAKAAAEVAHLGLWLSTQFGRFFYGYRSAVPVGLAASEPAVRIRIRVVSCEARIPMRPELNNTRTP